MCYKLADLRSGIRIHVSKKMKDHIHSSSLIYSVSDGISQASRSTLRLSLWKFQNSFQEALREKEYLVENNNKAIQESKTFAAYFLSLVANSDGLLAQVSQITLDS